MESGVKTEELRTHSNILTTSLTPRRTLPDPLVAGRLYRNRESGDVYIAAYVYKGYRLINLRTGNHWSNNGFGSEHDLFDPLENAEIHVKATVATRS